MFWHRWFCHWFVLTTLVLPFCVVLAGAAAGLCCSLDLLGPAALPLFLLALLFCRLCLSVHWFCHSFCAARWFCNFVFCPTGFAACFSVGPPAGFAAGFGEYRTTNYFTQSSLSDPPASYYILASVIALYSIYNIGLKGSVTARGMDKHATLSSEVHALPYLVVAFLVLGAMRVRCWCLRTYDVGTMLLGLSGTIVGLS